MPTKLLLGILFIGLAIIRLSSGILSSTIPSLILTITLIIAGLFYLKSYLFGRNRCPNCSNEEMIPVNSLETESKFLQINKQNIYGSLALFLVGLLGTTVLLSGGIYSPAIFFDTIGFMICLGVGSYGLYTNLIITDNCEICGTKQTMIPLDSPEAQALIKKNKLIIPEQASKQSSPETSQ